MSRSATDIRFAARLLRPARPEGAAWTFLVLPRDASAKLPTRSMTAVEGTFEGQSFTATLEPDGQGSHWLRIDEKLREAAGAQPGELVELAIGPARQQPEPEVPADLRQALDDAPEAQATWADITTIARRDWIQWITSAKRPETRVRRIGNACDMLGSGKRRVCCFDRSGIYSKGFAAPEAADQD